jgi:hypothetical protein
MSTPHEPATTASTHPRALARTETLVSHSTQTALPTLTCISTDHPSAILLSTLSRCNCHAQPPTATSQVIRIYSSIYKTHRLPRGAASFKSLYLKRPSRAPPIDYLSRGGRLRYSPKTFYEQVLGVNIHLPSLGLLSLMLRRMLLSTEFLFALSMSTAGLDSARNDVRCAGGLVSSSMSSDRGHC